MTLSFRFIQRRTFVGQFRSVANERFEWHGEIRTRRLSGPQQLSAKLSRPEDNCSSSNWHGLDTRRLNFQYLGINQCRDAGVEINRLARRSDRND